MNRIGLWVWTTPGQGVTSDEWLSASETIPEGMTWRPPAECFPRTRGTYSLKERVPQGTTEAMEEKLSRAKRKSGQT